jgi:ubiquinone/menaquinone biosynthesis C-methylase UbiE
MFSKIYDGILDNISQNITAIDISPQMLSVAKEKGAKRT